MTEESGGAEEAGWETVCTMLEEVERFVEGLAQSQDSSEKAMHDMLSSSVWGCVGVCCWWWGGGLQCLGICPPALLVGVAA